MRLKKAFCWFLVFVLGLVAFAGASCADGVTYPDEYGRHIQHRSQIQATRDLFGERIDLSSGGLEFVQTDIELTGIGPNVRVGRRFRPGDSYRQGLFRYWDIDLPHVHGVFSKDVGWPGWGQYGARCSQFSAPPDVTFQGINFVPDEYWSGSFLYVPGVGEQELLERSSAPVPNDGNVYPVVTKNDFVVRCVPLASTSQSGAAGEGFEVVDKNGTVYTLNQYVSRVAATLVKSSPAPRAIAVYNLATNYILPRQEILLYPTQVKDRFGNTVTYVWSSVNPWQLLRIQASDGRRLDFSYVDAASNRIKSVSDGVHVWTYYYSDATGFTDEPDKVIFPDGSVWVYRLAKLFYAPMSVVSASCDNLSVGSSPYSGSITSPSGDLPPIAIPAVTGKVRG